jgi:hypothetical protein
VSVDVRLEVIEVDWVRETVDVAVVVRLLVWVALTDELPVALTVVDTVEDTELVADELDVVVAVVETEDEPESDRVEEALVVAVLDCVVEPLTEIVVVPELDAELVAVVDCVVTSQLKNSPARVLLMIAFMNSSVSTHPLGSMI